MKLFESNGSVLKFSFRIYPQEPVTDAVDVLGVVCLSDSAMCIHLDEVVCELCRSVCGFCWTVSHIMRKSSLVSHAGNQYIFVLFSLTSCLSVGIRSVVLSQATPKPLSDIHGTRDEDTNAKLHFCVTFSFLFNFKMVAVTWQQLTFLNRLYNNKKYGFPLNMLLN